MFQKGTPQASKLPIRRIVRGKARKVESSIASVPELLREFADLLKRNDVVTGLYGGNALTDRLDDTGALVSQNNGESALGILARQSVGICEQAISAILFCNDWEIMCGAHLCGRHRYSRPGCGLRVP